VICRSWSVGTPPAEVLKMATADNADLLALSGPRNPYPGKLGVVEEGALADRS
jgi:imidazolonepropionase-like amidohydrolase